MLSGQRPLQIFGSGEQTRTLTHVDDIADGIVTAMGSPAGLNEDFNISASRELTVAEIARIVWEACGEDPAAFALEHLPSFTVDVQRRWPSVEKARKLLGWEARIGVEEGIAATVRWLRERRASRAVGPPPARHGARVRRRRATPCGAVGSGMAVPCSTPPPRSPPLREELRAAVERVLDSERYILGPEVAAFEQEFAAYCGAAHAVGVANGTDAITIALRAMGVGPGDEVVVPSFTFYASAEAIPPTGATPVFCDIDPDTYCVTADTVRAALTPAHEGGDRGAPVRQRRPGRRDRGARRARARGRRPGRRLALAPPGGPARSARPRRSRFFPSKNLGCFGDGGAITTSDAELAERVRMLRFHGSRDKVTYEQVGYNSRLDELQAAILRVQLPHLDAWADGRRAAGAHYEQAGLGELVALPRARRRRRARVAPLRDRPPRRADALEAALAAAGIGHKAYYRTPIHRQAAMRAWGAGVELPATDHAARTHLAIPMSPVLTRAQAEEVLAAARGV